MSEVALHRGPFETPLLARVLERIREQVDPEYGFLAPGAPPWSPLRAPLERACVALVTTAGLHRRDDRPFRALEERFGDPSFRVIAHGTPAAELCVDAPYVDSKYTPADPEVALPMRALEALARERAIGAAAARHYGFVGGVVRALPGLAESAAAMEPLLREDGVHALVLIPTCSLCVQTTSVLARELEARGFATACLSLLPELSRIAAAPRTLALRFPFGAPCGDPGHGELHRAVLREALALLATETEAGAVRASSLQWKRAPGPAGERMAAR